MYAAKMFSWISHTQQQINPMLQMLSKLFVKSQLKTGKQVSFV